MKDTTGETNYYPVLSRASPNPYEILSSNDSIEDSIDYEHED